MKKFFRALNNKRKANFQVQRKGSILVKLEGNMGLHRPLPGDYSKVSMMFWLDQDEKRKIHMEKV